jgi:phosphoribosylamine--glycine ligase
MKEILFISALGDSIAMAVHLKNEGHTVYYNILDPHEQDCCDGLIEKVKNWRPYVNKVDAVFIDDVEQKVKGAGKFLGGGLAETLRKELKIPVFGGTIFGDQLENDRLFAQQVFEKAGLDVVPMVEFHDFKSAMDFVNKNPGPYAVKHCEQVPRDLNGAQWTPEEVIETLEWQEANWKTLNGGPVHFVLQEAVKGIEIAITGFIKDAKVVEGTVYLNQEIKKLESGNYGPSTGQVGEVGRFLDDPKLYERTLEKLAPMLKDGYMTWFDLNCIIAGNKIVPLEASSRPGYPTCYTFFEGLKMDVGDFLDAVINDKKITHTNEYLSNVVVATDPFPFEDEDKAHMALVRGLDKIDLDHLWPEEIRVVNGQVLGAGHMGYLCVVTSKGKTIEDCVKQNYDMVEKIKVIPYAKVRNDIGSQAKEDFPKLVKEGWFS